MSVSTSYSTSNASSSDLVRHLLCCFSFFLFLILSFLIRQQKGQFGGCQADTSTWGNSLLLLTLVASKGQQKKGSDSSRTSGPLLCECKGYKLFFHTVGNFCVYICSFLGNQTNCVCKNYRRKLL